VHKVVVSFLLIYKKMHHSIRVNQPFLQLCFNLNDNGKEKKRVTVVI